MQSTGTASSRKRAGSTNSRAGRKQPAQPGERGAAPTTARLEREARVRFGVEHLRPGQREVLEAVLSGRDTLALMPTGAGKSLCYQLPAVLLRHPVVVVSPLIALMEDQKEKAEEAAIAVTAVNSTLNAAEKREAEEAVAEGRAQLVYVTPERLEDREFVESLRAAGVSLLAVDEAHCISQWGHDFRPAYMELGRVRAELGDPPVLALTATATDQVAADIMKQLRMRHPLVVNTGIERKNLVFAVRPTVNEEAKRRAVIEAIAAIAAADGGPGIVYTASVKTANALHAWLREALPEGVAVGLYHGRLPTREREEVQARFMAGGYRVLVATKAFGMGIDKPDIRLVCHYEFPDSLESYYQEAGRAGRDGEAAHAMLLYRLEDRRIQSFFLAGRAPKLHDLQMVFDLLGEPAAGGASSAGAPAAELAARAEMGVRRMQALLQVLGASGLVLKSKGGYRRRARVVTEEELKALIVAGESRAGEDHKRLEEMMHYAESPECRRLLMRRYFGEEPGERCGQCDNCEAGVAGATALEVPRSARAALEAVMVVETGTGVVETTAPETLREREKPGFALEARVRHKRFGWGVVVEVDGENCRVRFETGVRRVRAGYLVGV